MNVRYWHLADIEDLRTNVRFRGVKRTSRCDAAMSALTQMGIGAGCM
jgi:hypothetical protein